MTRWAVALLLTQILLHKSVVRTGASVPIPKDSQVSKLGCAKVQPFVSTFFHTNYHTFEGNIYHTSLWIVTRIRYGIYALVLVEHIRPLILILHHRVKWGLRCRSEQRTGRGELSEETILRNPEIEITSLKAHQITPKMIQFNTASFLVHLGCGIVILPVGSW